MTETLVPHISRVYGSLRVLYFFDLMDADDADDDNDGMVMDDDDDDDNNNYNEGHRILHEWILLITKYCKISLASVHFVPLTPCLGVLPLTPLGA